MAREMGIIKRQSKISGQSLVQGLVFGWLENPQASETQIAQSVGRAGEAVTAQAVNARYTEATAEFLRKVLERTAQIIVSPGPGTQTLLNRFEAVHVNDSTTVTLPNELSRIWRGCKNRTEDGQAAVKIQTQWELRAGTLTALTLHDGREQDRSAPVQHAQISAGSLRLADLGYFDLSLFERIEQAPAYWMSRYLSGVTLYFGDGVSAGEGGEAMDLGAWLKHNCPDDIQIDISVFVGQKKQLAARLVAIRVPQHVADERRRKLHDKARGKAQAASSQSLMLATWNIFLTNVPSAILNVSEVLIIARARWQIELLFKLWKSSGHLDDWRSKKPFRILCEFYAKLIGQIIQHWLIIFIAWHHADRSMTKAAAAIKSCLSNLLAALHSSSNQQVDSVIGMLARSTASTCRISKRNSKKALFQLLAVDHP